MVSRHLKRRRLLQKIACLADEFTKFVLSRFAGNGLEFRVRNLQRPEFERCHAGVIDVRRRTAIGQRSPEFIRFQKGVCLLRALKLRNGFEIGIENVEEVAGCRGLGTGVLRLVREHLVQRIESKQRCARGGQPAVRPAPDCGEALADPYETSAMPPRFFPSSSAISHAIVSPATPGKSMVIRLFSAFTIARGMARDGRSQFDSTYCLSRDSTPMPFRSLA